jgi:hypothetical protein
VERSTPLHVELVGPVGLVGPWAIVPAHRAPSGRLISCRAGPALWAENEAQPNVVLVPALARKNHAGLVLVSGQKIVLWAGPWASC